MDLWEELCRRACQQSADYVLSAMPEAVFYVEDKKAFQKSVLTEMKLDGLIAEFGVYEGNSLRLFASMTDKKVHGFDSFEGLPEAWAGHNLDRGFFSRITPGVFPANVTLHKGWFSDTLPGFLKEYSDNFAFIHIDCDLYSSTKDVLDLCNERIVPGTVIVFDEYLNYPNWQNHEYRAFQEFMKMRPDLNYKYTKVCALGYTYSAGSVAVEILTA